MTFLLFLQIKKLLLLFCFLYVASFLLCCYLRNNNRIFTNTKTATAKAAIYIQKIQKIYDWVITKKNQFVLLTFDFLIKNCLENFIYFINPHFNIKFANFFPKEKSLTKFSSYYKIYCSFSFSLLVVACCISSFFL